MAATGSETEFPPLASKTIWLRHFKDEKWLYFFWDWKRPYDTQLLVPAKMDLLGICNEARKAFSLPQDAKIVLVPDGKAAPITDSRELRDKELYIVSIAK